MEQVENSKDLPELGSETIHIWGVHLPDVLDRLEGLHAVLCDKEQKKAARFYRESDRQSSIAARGALRILLSGYTGIPAAEITFQYSENGKPSLSAVPQASRLHSADRQGRRDACGTKVDCKDDDNSVAFNVSHSADWVVLAFGRNRNVGVDVEKIKRSLDVEAIADRYFAPEEIALIENAEDRHALFFQLWARKEAYVKACGSALFRELGSFTVPLSGKTLPDIGKKEGWIFQRLEAGSKYAAALVTDKEVANVPCYDFGGLKWDS